MRDEVKKTQVRIGNMVYQLSATEDAELYSRNCIYRR